MNERSYIRSITNGLVLVFNLLLCTILVVLKLHCASGSSKELVENTGFLAPPLHRQTCKGGLLMLVHGLMPVFVRIFLIHGKM